MPAFEDATFTDEHTLCVCFKASGIHSKKASSPRVQPFSTRAENPPMKLTLTAFAASSKTFAKYT